MRYVLFLVLVALVVSAPAANANAEEQELTSIDTVVLFPPDVATPGPKIAPLLEQVAAVLRAHPSVRVEVAGHCDDHEMVEVAYARANLVASGLAARGVPRERTVVATYGTTRPLGSNKTEEGRAKNRRVDFKVLR